MIAYYGSKISEHMTKTPEGFLICHDVPIARIGSRNTLPGNWALTAILTALCRCSAALKMCSTRQQLPVSRVRM